MIRVSPSPGVGHAGTESRPPGHCNEVLADRGLQPPADKGSQGHDASIVKVHLSPCQILPQDAKTQEPRDHSDEVPVAQMKRVEAGILELGRQLGLPVPAMMAESPVEAAVECGNRGNPQAQTPTGAEVRNASWPTPPRRSRHAPARSPKLRSPLPGARRARSPKTGTPGAPPPCRSIPAAGRLSRTCGRPARLREAWRTPVPGEERRWCRSRRQLPRRSYRDTVRRRGRSPGCIGRPQTLRPDRARGTRNHLSPVNDRIAHLSRSKLCGDSCRIMVRRKDVGQPKGSLPELELLSWLDWGVPWLVGCREVQTPRRRHPLGLRRHRDAARPPNP